jgi:hypothetical protein
VRKIPSWVDETYPRYFQLVGMDFSHDEAAQQLKEEFSGLLQDKQIGTITRNMRGLKQEIQERFDEYHNNVFAAIGANPSYGEVQTAPELQVPPPLGGTFTSPVLSKYIDIPYADGHVWCDCHVPNHNDGLIEKSLRRAKEQGGMNLYIAGDFLDMSWASKFVAWGQAGPEQVKEEFAIAKKIIQLALEVFENIYIIPGNHDGTRFKYMSNGSLGFENLFVMAMGSADMLNKRVHVGERRYMVLRDSKWGDWRITHPQSARAVPLSLAQTIALKEQQNVLTAHQHYFGMGFDRYGHFMICDGGHMTNEELTEYKMEMDTAHSNWAPGYVELVDGWPYLIPDDRGRA